MKTLVNTQPGDEVVVTGLSGGCGVQHNLVELGVIQGCHMKVCSKYGLGHVVVETEHGRMALGHGMASKVIVDTVETQKEAVNADNVMTLADAAEGDRLIITKVTASKAIKQRLLDMGIVTNTEVQVERYAPLRDPIQIKVKGYNLALRVSEGKTIYVRKIEHL